MQEWYDTMPYGDHQCWIGTLQNIYQCDDGIWNSKNHRWQNLVPSIVLCQG